MTGARANRWTLTVRMLCMFALLCLGFAHRMPTQPVLTPVEIAALTLPDGTLPEICLNDRGDDAHKGKPLLVRDCEACRIATAVALPMPPQIASIPMPVTVPAILTLKAEASYRPLFPPNTAPRAPPFPTSIV